MREERQDVNRSPAGATVSHGQVGPNDSAAGGFTAVNGDPSKQAAYRHEKAPQRISSTVEGFQDVPREGPRLQTWAPYAEHRAELVDDYSACHIGRPRDRSVGSPKRNREETVDEAQSYAKYSNDDERPAKQRRTHAVDSAVDPYPSDRMLPDLQKGSAAAPSTAGGPSREMTPARRVNASQPPPKPHPETEARLAESLQRELGTAAATPQAVEHHSPTSQTTPYSGPRQYSPDQLHQGDSSEGRKGKRNYRPRTKTGCHTCRRRKKKCDEGHPYCANCIRGNFSCEGYGPKPPSGAKSNPSRNNVPLQAKHPYEPSHGPVSHYPMQEGPPAPPPPQHQGTSYSHWGRVEKEPQHRYGEPHPEEARHGGHRESYAPIPRPATHEHPPYAHPEQYMHPDYNNSIPPLHSLVRDTAPGAWNHPAAAALTPYRGPPGPDRMLSSHGSVSSDRTSHHPHSQHVQHQRAAQLALSFTHTSQLSEKDKMLLGKPYLHYLDTVLCADREACKSALERYNDAARPSSGVSTGERARLFRAIVDPSTRAGGNNPNNPTNSSTNPPRHLVAQAPTGRIGHRTLVETPFNCDYGYNLHIGDDSVVGANCYMMDPCDIVIGDRCIIGPNVKFYGMTAAVDSRNRKGSQGAVVGGAIVVEDDVVIGGDAVVMPYRTIGKGAFVGAGCVVTKDVKPNTVVVGNPMQLVRGIGGADIERHKEPIQQENEAMLAQMQARRGYRES